ncbi:MAG: DUF2812 domain-containing protein [Lachnospiraceae bacterium]|nr:DUF2812 domain-containing protein [Lachnospiraceae bacterium]
MKNTKRQFTRFAFYDQTAMEKHFEKMASEGWLIEKISTYFLHYRRIEPQKLHFTVTYFPDASEFDPSPKDKHKMMEDFAARDGWKLLTRWGQMQVFCNEAEKPIPIETDAVTQVENIYRSMKKNLLPAHLMILALAIWQLVFNGYRAFTETVDFLSTPYLLASVPIWLLLLLAEINEILACYLWHRKAKPAAENGVFVPVKTNHFISFTLILSCVFVLIATIFLPSELRLVSLCWIAIVVGINLIGNVVKRKLKKAGAPKGLNYTVTILIIILLTFTLLTGLVVFILRYGLDDGREPVGSYDINGWTFEIYDEEMPLYVEDMMEIGDSEWSREHNEHNETLLLSKSEYRQNHMQGGPEGLKDLEYTIIDIKVPALYDIVKQSILNERQDEVYDDVIFTDHYEPIDATLWQADEAYQVHWSGTILDTYLICWENRIVEVKFYWQPTPEQIAIVVDKLKTN